MAIATTRTNKHNGGQEEIVQKQKKKTKCSPSTIPTSSGRTTTTITKRLRRPASNKTYYLQQQQQRVIIQQRRRSKKPLRSWMMMVVLTLLVMTMTFIINYNINKFIFTTTTAEEQSYSRVVVTNVPTKVPSTRRTPPPAAAADVTKPTPTTIKWNNSILDKTSTWKRNAIHNNNNNNGYDVFDCNSTATTTNTNTNTSTNTSSLTTTSTRCYLFRPKQFFDVDNPGYKYLTVVNDMGATLPNLPRMTHLHYYWTTTSTSTGTSTNDTHHQRQHPRPRPHDDVGDNNNVVMDNITSSSSSSLLFEQTQNVLQWQQQYVPNDVTFVHMRKTGGTTIHHAMGYFVRQLQQQRQQEQEQLLHHDNDNNNNDNNNNHDNDNNGTIVPLQEAHMERFSTCRGILKARCQDRAMTHLRLIETHQREYNNNSTSSGRSKRRRTTTTTTKRYHQHRHVVFAMIKDPIHRFLSAVGQAMDDSLPSGRRLRQTCLDEASVTNTIHCVLNILQRKGLRIDVHFCPMAVNLWALVVKKNKEKEEEEESDMTKNAPHGGVFDIEIALFEQEYLSTIVQFFGVPNLHMRNRSNPNYTKSALLSTMSVHDLDEASIRIICQLYAIDVEMLAYIGVTVPLCVL